MATLTVPAKKEYINQLLDLLHQQLDRVSCPLKISLELELAVEEAFVNIATHAYVKEGGTATFDCEVEPDAGLVILRFTDQGLPFNPLGKKDPDTALSADQRPIGGLGIFLIKKTMDKCAYTYHQGANVFTLTKKYK